TIPTFGFDPDSRSSRISLSAQSVSPAKTGFGSEMSVHARLAAAFSLVSGTVMPVTSASVNVLFTSGRPNCVRSAYGVLKWIWFVFRVRQVNQMLSVSVIVRPSLLANLSPTAKSSKKRPRHCLGAAWVSVLTTLAPFSFRQDPPRPLGDGQ